MPSPFCSRPYQRCFNEEKKMKDTIFGILMLLAMAFVICLPAGAVGFKAASEIREMKQAINRNNEAQNHNFEVHRCAVNKIIEKTYPEMGNIRTDNPDPYCPNNLEKSDE